MKASELIALFERMHAEHWAYEWGAAREGCVDCSGAFVYAFKQYGQSIAHGSNAIARELIRSGRMHPVSQARPGWALFKHAFDGNEPDKYKADGLGNYKHIALCSRDGKRALNAKGEQYGFCSDSLSGYSYAAPLLGVDYGEEKDMDMLYQAIVTTQKDPLRVRALPETGAVIGHVPRGEMVDVIADGDWPRIRYDELVGYVSGAYMQKVEQSVAGTDQNVVESDQNVVESDQNVTETGQDVITVPIPRELAQQMYKALGMALSMD